jgi:hypothetical protein
MTDHDLVEIITNIDTLSNNLYESILMDGEMDDLDREDARELVKEVERLKIVANIPRPVYIS